MSLHRSSDEDVKHFFSLTHAHPHIYGEYPCLANNKKFTHMLKQSLRTPIHLQSNMNSKFSCTAFHSVININFSFLNCVNTNHFFFFSEFLVKGTFVRKISFRQRLQIFLFKSVRGTLIRGKDVFMATAEWERWNGWEISKVYYPELCYKFTLTRRGQRKLYLFNLI